MHKTLKAVMTVGLLLAGGHAVAQTGQQPSAPVSPTMSAAEIEALAMVESCLACHGKSGISRDSARPNLAGQKADYLSRQLFMFRQSSDELAGAKEKGAEGTDGAAKPRVSRADPLMSHMAVGLSDDRISYIARALSRMPCDGGETKAAAVKPPVKPLIAQRCEGCHGGNGISPMPQVPNIAGQQRDYLRRQLLIIRENAWGAASGDNERWRTHPIMERQTGRFSIEDVDALAQYFAALDCRGVATQ